MIIRLAFIISIVLFAVQDTFGQAVRDTYKIDTLLQKCMAKDNSDAGMISCLEKAEKDWDNELNKYYKLLLNKLDTADQKNLKESQRQWIIYRDKEINFFSTLYSKKDGSMWNVSIADNRMQIIRKRAIELLEYYEAITQN